MKYIRMLAITLAIALLPVAAVRAEVTYGTGMNRAGGGNGYEQAYARRYEKRCKVTRL